MEYLGVVLDSEPSELGSVKAAGTWHMHVHMLNGHGELRYKSHRAAFIIFPPVLFLVELVLNAGASWRTSGCRPLRAGREIERGRRWHELFRGGHVQRAGLVVPEYSARAVAELDARRDIHESWRAMSACVIPIVHDSSLSRATLEWCCFHRAPSREGLKAPSGLGEWCCCALDAAPSIPHPRDAAQRRETHPPPRRETRARVRARRVRRPTGRPARRRRAGRRRSGASPAIMFDTIVERTYMCVCVYIYMCVYIYIYIYVCVYIYTHT